MILVRETSINCLIAICIALCVSSVDSIAFLSTTVKVWKSFDKNLSDKNHFRDISLYEKHNEKSSHLQEIILVIAVVDDDVSVAVN